MYKFFKRLMDIVISLFTLILVSPIMLLIIILIRIDSKGSAIFKQKRIGFEGREFYIYKFRSMLLGSEQDGIYEKKNDNRVTRVGRFLRKTSIDELPQLINIIKGDMSIIGPRPPLTYHPYIYEQYTVEQLRRFSVRPGVTGWAQINGRKNVKWDKRIKLDIYYVNNISISLDIKIFLKTIIKVITNKDNYNKIKTGE